MRYTRKHSERYGDTYCLPSPLTQLIPLLLSRAPTQTDYNGKQNSVSRNSHATENTRLNAYITYLPTPLIRLSRNPLSQMEGCLSGWPGAVGVTADVFDVLSNGILRMFKSRDTTAVGFPNTPSDPINTGERNNTSAM